ncbi:hypothetical protein [Sphingomonas sp. PAMC 26617]|uniref:hypothetical protein n=1 Tax=Sphingomonas sp. PAMC 26617 TaxID=1112216 RepID=UPI00028A0762|nr:hypothetical protein [Sphingomonas sp. PAMC 26617]
MNALTTQATRRAIFGTIGLGVAAVTVAAAAPVAALSAPAGGVSPELARLIAAAQAAEAASDNYTREVYEPARQAWLKEREAFPHFTMMGTDDMSGKPIRYSTDDKSMFMIAKAVSRGSRAEAYVRDARAFLAGYWRRSRKIDQLASTKIMHAAHDRDDALCDALSRAIDAVIAFPCASIADLNAKMAKVMQWDSLGNEGTGIMIASDVARLAREA